MLITSRVPLHVSGEHEFPVPPLAVPAETDGSYLESGQVADAVRLFVSRAQAVQPDFSLTAENAHAIAGIVRQLDGLPLAIELAAAQSKHLSPGTIAERLVAPGDLLKGGPVDRAPHQRAIRETIAWSYELLDLAEQQAFRTLSIFSGGFLPQAAAFVLRGDDAPPVVQLPDGGMGVDSAALTRCISLSDKNLIGRVADVQGEPRFSMLFTIRTFGRSELRRCGEWEAAADRHARWYLAFAERAAREIEGAAQKIWLDWLELEHANLRDTLAWFRDREDIDRFARMANALSTFWLIHGHFSEGQRWLQSVIDEAGTTPVAPELFSDLMSAAGWLALRQGCPHLARTWAEASLEQARRNVSAIESAEALNLLAHIEHRFTDYARAEALFTESLEYYEQSGHTIGQADTLTSLATVAMDAGRFDDAAILFERAAVAAAATGDSIAHARVIDNQGVLAYARGDAATSLGYAEQALAMYREHGSLRGTGVALDHVGKCARSLGDIPRAWACHQESLAIRREVGDARGIAVWLEAVLALLVTCGRYERAAWALGAVDGIRERGGFPLYGNEAVEQRWAVRCTSDNLAPDVFARHWARGGTAPLEQVIATVHAEAERAVISPAGQRQAQLPELLAERGLTPREIEVVQHVARRMTDKEIGVQLGISSRTVSTHVTVILAKLGVRSRREAAHLVDELLANT
jgi:predicted ATPase/DNA-binding CsgD family transcriptional regulator